MFVPLPLAILMVTTAIAPGQVAAAPAGEFDYDRTRAFDLTTHGAETRRGVTIQDVSYATLAGGRNRAYLVLPPGAGPHPGILFVHWLEDDNPTSNRTEFLEDAVEMAASAGVVSLLPDTMWAVPGWFVKRNPVEDYAASAAQVKELRRALDLLASRPGVDPRRLLYVGHDFGAMYGALVAGLDASRLRGFVYMAGTRSFSDWFLLHPKLEGEARQRVIDRLAPLDPTLFLGRAAPLPMLFQFGTRDRFVSRAAGEALVAAAGACGDARWYEVGHALDASATRERAAWLKALIAKIAPGR